MPSAEVSMNAGNTELVSKNRALCRNNWNGAQAGPEKTAV